MLRALLLVSLVVVLAAAAHPQFPRLMTGATPGELAGIEMACAGDVDGDGVLDVISGSPFGAPTTMPTTPTGQRGFATVYSGATGAVLWTFQAALPDTLFGYGVGGAGDIDGDGRADLIVGEPWSDVGYTRSGAAHVYSGLDGSLLFTRHGVDWHDWFGYAVSGAGDVDGDGRDDFMVGAPAETDFIAIPPTTAPPFAHGAVHVYSGVDGSEILWLADNLIQNGYANNFGSSMAAVGDLNGDGHDDVLVGAPKLPYYPDPVYGGYARVYSGLDGSPLLTVMGAPDERAGYVGAAGDVDADGTPDVIVGGRGGSAALLRARVFSGATGNLLHTFTGEPELDEFGLAACGVGDVDGDGHDDVLVGAPQHSSGGPGYARVYSGQSGLQIWGMSGLRDGDHFGYAVAPSDDLDGDGVPEAVIGAPHEAGHAGVGRLVSLRYGLELTEAPNSVTSTFWADRAGIRLMLAIDVPLPSPGHLPTEFGDLYTSIGNPGPSLLVLDGLGATGPPRADMVTGPDGSWSRTFTVNPAAFSGSTFVMQTYAYDEQRPWIERLIVSNPAGLEF